MNNQKREHASAIIYMENACQTVRYERACTERARTKRAHTERTDAYILKALRVALIRIRLLLCWFEDGMVLVGVDGGVLVVMGVVVPPSS